MAVSVLYMAMSVDGYIAGPDDRPGNPGGDGFARLHEWGVDPDGEGFRLSGAAGELFAEIEAAGAVVAGRRTVEQVDHWGGDRHGHGVRIFVPSHRPPGPSVANYPLVTYVSDGIESAMAQAKAAAGDRDVLVHGAYPAHRALEAGVLDELIISQGPGAVRRRSPHVRRASSPGRAGDRQPACWRLASPCLRLTSPCWRRARPIHRRERPTRGSCGRRWLHTTSPMCSSYRWLRRGGCARWSAPRRVLRPAGP